MPRTTPLIQEVKTQIKVIKMVIFFLHTSLRATNKFRCKFVHLTWIKLASPWHEWAGGQGDCFADWQTGGI